ncbi:MAG: hypothetical protein H6684_05070 [Deltaproteobacteria bacterium]|nr:hypothetical protein [Deltaproteobacteria bacterium]
MGKEQIRLFWSWQSDSPTNTNRNFIQDCIDKAGKNIGNDLAVTVALDRDTASLGGSPGISDSIFTKIRSCDIFIWDATIVHIDPKFSPNPNVLIELGYAIAIVGWARIIGVMNVNKGHGPEKLPFHLQHRRWPITYSLDATTDSSTRKTAKKELTRKFEDAILLSLDEPKRGVLFSDTDFLIVKRLWKLIDSHWVYSWISERETYPQYERSEYLDIILKYRQTAIRPENRFKNKDIKQAHESLTRALYDYSLTTAKLMIPANGEGVFKLSIKDAPDHIDDYDEKYDRDVDAILACLDAIRKAWDAYIDIISGQYPEVIQ